MTPKNLEKLFLVIAILSNIAITSCSNKKCSFDTISKEIVSNSSMDSISIIIKDTLILDIGDYINPIPYHDIVVNENGKDLYIVEDDGNVYTFDLFSNKLIDTKSINNGGRLSGLSGIAFNNGILWTYDYKNSRINAYGNDSIHCMEYHLPNNNEEVNAWVMSDMPLIITSDYIYISGPPFQNPYKQNKDYPTTLAFDKNTGQTRFVGYRGEPYNDTHFFCGNDNMWRVYQCLGLDSCILISTPLNPRVYKFDVDFNYIGSHNIGSRYSDKTIFSAKYNEKFSEDDDKVYYLGNHTYRSILYDSIDSLYYRIATHPNSNFSHERSGMKSFSVIVASKVGEILSETSIINNPNKFYYDKVFMTTRGLLMQIYSPDETKIKFIVFSYNKSKSNEN